MRLRWIVTARFATSPAASTDNGNHMDSVRRDKPSAFGMRLLGEPCRTSHARAE